MTKTGLLPIFLLGLFASNISWAQQEKPAPATRKEQKQLPPASGEGKQIYIPGLTPYLWEHHGADPYFPVPDRNALVEFSKKQGLLNDLTGQGFTQAEAEYLQRALVSAENPDSKAITETTLSLNTPIQKMRFGHGVKDMVILKGKSEEAWQIILPPELGSKVVWLPKVCGNICVSPFLAQIETVVFKTDVQERTVTVTDIKERIVEKPVYISEPVYYPVDRPVYIDRPVYQESEASYSRCGKKCKIIIGVLAGAGASAGVYFGKRGHKNRVAIGCAPGGGGGVN